MPERPARHLAAAAPPAGPDRRVRGQLWVYLGAAPGVGKTRAMQEGARGLQARGGNVLLCEAAAALPVERILQRPPAVCLVPQLAHKNPEGARHPYRWQDVQELLDNGIDVHTTLDVRSVEGLLDAVHEITPARIRNWVPDAFLAEASEVIFVDAPPASLTEPLPQSAALSGHPADHLRREGMDPAALSALRKLALQYALDHTQRASRNRRPAADATPELPKVLVYLDTLAHAAGLLQAGQRVASALHTGWLVAYREPTNRAVANLDREQVQACLQQAERLGADVLALDGSAIGPRMADLVGRYNIGSVVLANPARTLWQGRHSRAVLRALKRQAPGVDVVLVEPQRSVLARHLPAPAEPGLPAPATAPHSPQLRPLLWSLAVPALATAVSTTLFRHSEPTNHLIIYLLGVLVVASRQGFWPSAVAALLSVLASDFLLIAPYYSFAVARPQDVVTLAVFLLAALAASRVADNLRFQSERAQQRELRVRFLYEFTNALADVPSMDEAVAIAGRRIARQFGVPCQMLLADSAARIPAPQATAGAAAPHPAAPFDLALAQQAFDTGAIIGWGAGGRQARAPATYVPISAAAHRFGVLMLGRGEDSRALQAEKRRMVATLASQIAQCLERMRLTREAQAATAQAQAESLRNSLLNAIAHDFRTPLASIVAASSTLTQGGGRLHEGQMQELAQSILEEGQHMTRLANNTLELARLEAGNIRLQREWYPLDEIIGAAVTRLGSRLQGRPLRTQLPEGVPMAHGDAVMIVQVLENLIENALKYTPAGAPIEIGADEQPGLATFWVADSGAGIAPGEEMAIFEKFYRGRSQESRGGVGLGLTISRIIVTAHGGTIAAHNRAGGGAEFRFTIPCTQARPEMTAEE